MKSLNSLREKVLDFNKTNTYTGESKKGYGVTYFAKKNFKKGDIVMSSYGKYLDHQTPHSSVQIGIKKHFLPTYWSGKFWNHSCDPNNYAKTNSNGFVDLIALREIKKDEEITYSYWMTEYEWSNGADEVTVKCKCKAKNCKGKILSFSQLTPREQKSVRGLKHCTNYLFLV